MTDRLGIVTAFLQSLRGHDAAPRREFLTEDVVFTALLRLEGREAIIARMTAADTGRVYREAEWAEPQADGDAVRVTGHMPPGSPLGGAILRFHFRGTQISLIQYQPIPGAPIPADELKMPPRLKALVNNALVSRHPMVVAYVGSDGQPVLSFRGSTQAYSDDQLAIWVRNTGGNFLAAIRRNPKVALMYRDEDTKETFQFQGRAWIAESEDHRRRVYENAAEFERSHDYARTGAALIIDLDFVEGWFGLTPDGPIDRLRMVRGQRHRAP